ncbi:MAG: 4Fe-4S dicluster domain-containing protein [Chloroflexi bacterium]|nr:4Fe-4S dicluster domain-containing protein [Chloroflexota bacterium]MCL5025389.1 4Fe-4S dicluster domain-containing protein [Chloroflexota bacterium]
MSPTDELATRLNSVAEHMGATFFGVADLTLPGVHDFMVQRAGEEMLRSYPRAIAVGIALANSIVDQIPRALEQDDAAMAHLNSYHTYDVVVPYLNTIALRLTSMLQAEGYSAMPVPARGTSKAGATKLAGLVSNKLAAHLAGLGWIGKNCLLVTPQAGPRAWWVTVLTSAPLAAGTPMEERCGACHACVDVCPPRALAGRKFVESEPREERLDARRCADFRDQRAEVVGERGCGMCLYICPYGRNSQKPK